MCVCMGLYIVCVIVFLLCFRLAIGSVLHEHLCRSVEGYMPSVRFCSMYVLHVILKNTDCAVKLNMIHKICNRAYMSQCVIP